MRLIKLLDKYTQPNGLDFLIIIYGNFINAIFAAIFGIIIFGSNLGVISKTGWSLTFDTGAMLIIGLVYIYFAKLGYSTARMIQKTKNK